MDILTISTICSNVAVFVGGVVAIWQLFVMNKSFKADHERKKKQSTIEFYNNIKEKYFESLELIDEKFPNDEVLNINDIRDNNDLQKAIRNYLYHMEELSVGIEAGIYDIAIFEKISGVYTTRWFERLKEVILYFRKNSHNSIAYKSFEDLVSSLKYLREKRFPVEDIDFTKITYNYE